LWSRVCRLFPGKNHVRYSGPAMRAPSASCRSWGVVTGHLHASSAGPASCPLLPVRRAPRLGRGASCSALGGHWHVDGSLVKTMSDASDWRCWRLVRHIPVEGIVLGFLHAHAADSLLSLRPAVGGRFHLYRLPVLYRRVITMFIASATTSTNALPSLV